MSEETEVEEVSQVAEQVEAQEQVQESKQSAINHNWNQANEVLRLQKQRIEELESRLSQHPPQAKQEERDEFDDLDPEDTITIAQAKQLAKKLATKEAQSTAEQVVKKYIQEQAIVLDEQRMRTKYDDYDYVIQNFAAQMINNDPALAYKIQMSKNPAETAYKLAKISDEYEAAAMKQQPSPKAEKILKNSARPTSATTVGSPLKNQVDDFSKMSKQDIWSLSEKYARQA